VNTTTILDLIAARETAASAALDELRGQQAKLAAEVAGIECELADLTTTRQTLTKILEAEVTTSEPTIISEPYQQILAMFTAEGGSLRAKDVCRALGIGTEPKDTEGIRAKLKRLVNRQILTEVRPGLFTLTPTDITTRTNLSRAMITTRRPVNLPPGPSARALAGAMAPGSLSSAEARGVLIGSVAFSTS